MHVLLPSICHTTERLTTLAPQVQRIGTKSILDFCSSTKLTRLGVGVAMPGAEVSTGCFTPALLLNCTGRQQMKTEHQQQPLICKCYNYIHRWHTSQLDGNTVYKYICVCSDVCMVRMSTAALLIIFILGSIVRYIRELPHIQYVWCIYIHRYTCVVVCVHGVWGEGWGV